MPALVAGAILGAGGVLALSANDGSTGPARAPAGLHATLHRLGSHAELQVSGMPEPPIGEVYEVWLLRSGHPQPQATDALFTVTSAGSGTVEVPDGASRDVREVMVTSEPLGGSTSPTGPAVLRVRPSGAA